MSTKFFTNREGNSLLAKFNGIFAHAPEIKIFHCVSGYFRASGYHHLREKLLNLSAVKILVGIDVDKIHHHYRAKNQLERGFSLAQDLNNELQKIIVEDIINSDYTQQSEQSVLDYLHDLRAKKIEIRIHRSKKLHAKIYIFLPLEHNPHSAGTVITGSSNFTGNGLGATAATTNYEFNVELRDYEDVAFAEAEFQQLWADSIELTVDTVENAIKQTYLQKSIIEPYLLFLKFLYEYFGDSIDYDEDSIGEVPANFKKLKYQVDAVNEAYKMLLDFDGCFLADVVGLGKTVVATLIANKLAINNGKKKTRILVVYPPALEQNWKETFREFHLDKITDFISNGSLHKILADTGCLDKNEYAIIIVDEAHKFRNDKTEMYRQLQTITKAPLTTRGKIITRKKVILLSATPVNNCPEDLLNQILLFTDRYHSTLAVKNLGNYFAPKIATYKEIMKRETPEQATALEKIMTAIRRDIIQPLTVRRVRNDLEKREMYASDLREQQINFPQIAAPTTFEYQMDNELATLFNTTATAICQQLTYMRYQMIGCLTDDVLSEKYPDIDLNLTIRNLSKLMKTRMIKSLESSFAAFRSTLARLQRSTTEMIKMIANGKVYFVPSGKLQDWLDDDLTYEAIEEKITAQTQKKADGYHIFNVARDFDAEKLTAAKTQLQADEAILINLFEQWEKIDRDPKFAEFLAKLPAIIQSPENPENKLVIFSESKITADYLYQKLEKHKDYRGQILNICADNRANLFTTIRENFDANYPAHKRRDDFRIIISTEVLAEGVNLHRANCVLNYDIPWNSTKLMQRIGRVNRIGSRAAKIFIYAFYPSTQGDEQLNLKNTAHTKLQSFHYMFGNDSQVLSTKEQLIEVILHNPVSTEVESEKLKYLQIIRDVRRDQRELFDRIVRLSLKSRSLRAREPQNNHAISTAIFLRANEKCEFFVSEKDQLRSVDFIFFAKLLQCAPATPLLTPLPDFHYAEVNAALHKFQQIETAQAQQNNEEINDPKINKLLKRLRAAHHAINSENLDKITDLLKKGAYSNLRQAVEKALSSADVDRAIRRLLQNYDAPAVATPTATIAEMVKPQIILSESFI